MDNVRKGDVRVPVETGSACIDGAKIYFETAGSGSPFVFVHGGLADCRMWDDQFVFFAAHFRVIRYDARGFGRSDIPSGPFYPSKDLKALLDLVRLNKVYIIGQSMGGGIAIDFALEYPDRVEGLILVGPSVHGFSYSEAFLQKGLELFTTAQERGAEEGVRLLFKEPYWLYTLPPTEKVSLRSRMKEMATHFFQVFRWDPGWILPVRPLAVERLSEISTPTLIVAAERDHPENRKTAEMLLKEIKGAKKAEIPGVGHMMNMEEPEKFNKTVLHFLHNLGR